MEVEEDAMVVMVVYGRSRRSERLVVIINFRTYYQCRVR